MKGQTTTPFMIIISFLAFLMIISITYGIEKRTGDYVKEQSVKIQSDRVVNAVLTLESANTGFVEMDFDGYKIDVKDYNVTVGYQDTNSSSMINRSMVDYDSIERTEFQRVEGRLCVKKKIEGGSKVLSIEPGGC